MKNALIINAHQRWENFAEGKLNQSFRYGGPGECRRGRMRELDDLLDLRHGLKRIGAQQRQRGDSEQAERRDQSGDALVGDQDGKTSKRERERLRRIGLQREDRGEQRRDDRHQPVPRAEPRHRDDRGGQDERGDVDEQWPSGEPAMLVPSRSWR